jgi:DNA-binding SARP family transcriptional activator/tetratricopeptide (TPR) repeat protein
MAEVTEFCLLGPLLVRSGGAVVTVRPGKQRAILAALLLSGGKVVSLDELAEVLWGQEPPPSARVTIQNYVMRLRMALAETDGSRISTQPHGYQIRIDPGELDVTRFEALLDAARTAARDSSWDTVAAQSRAALLLWRGEPLSDVDSELLVAREMPRLTELRLQALEVRIEADLHLGRQAEVISELRRLVTEHPLREHLRRLLMLALYRDGRQAEALAAYQDARRALVEELGTEPGSRLWELHRRMLAGDPALAVPDPPPHAAGAAVPRELPTGVAHFTGRTSELAALSALLDAAGDQVPETVVISAIGGTAGVGKTALAVHWAHRAAARFPDGQLYVNLRGYDPGPPVSAADALAGFLRSLGVPGQDIPPEAEQRAARYRSLLAGKRMLVMLDNAGSADQVRPLLPGTPACSVVVTSRDALAGLVARDGAARLDLDVLPVQDAVALLRTLVGERANAEPEASAELADQCCRLPLALRVAAELAASRPAMPLAGLARELADLQRRLDLLDAGGDPRSAVRAVFSWSCRHLDTAAARAFRLISLHPGASLDPYAAAALTGTTVARAGQLLDQLDRAHLIQPAGPGRYTMHDLLRAYARQLTAAQDSEEERRVALTRLFDYYLHAAAEAMDALHPAERHRRPRVPESAVGVPPLTSPAGARAWLDIERSNLVAVAVHTAGNGWSGHTTLLGATLFRYFDIGGHFAEAATVQGHALRAARQAGDLIAEAATLTGLAAIDLRQGRYQQASGAYQEAVTLFRRGGDKTGESHALGNLGAVEQELGHYQQAAGQLRRALALCRETGDRSGEAHVLSHLGIIDLRRGRYQRAGGRFRQALALCRETGYQAGEIHALSHLGSIDLRQGRHQQAAGWLRQALALCRETGDRSSQAYILADLGLAGVRQGRHQEAAGYIEQALALCRETGNRAAEAQALNNLGELLLAVGQPAHARTQHSTALGLADQTGDEDEQARAHYCLGRAWQADGDLVQARHHWQEALIRYTAIGAPEARAIRAQLARADAGQDRQLYDTHPSG